MRAWLAVAFSGVLLLAGRTAGRAAAEPAPSLILAHGYGAAVGNPAAFFFAVTVPAPGIPVPAVGGALVASTDLTVRLDLDMDHGAATSISACAGDLVPILCADGRAVYYSRQESQGKDGLRKLFDSAGHEVQWTMAAFEDGGEQYLHGQGLHWAGPSGPLLSQFIAGDLTQVELNAGERVTGRASADPTLRRASWEGGGRQLLLAELPPPGLGPVDPAPEDWNWPIDADARPLCNASISDAATQFLNQDPASGSLFFCTRRFRTPYNHPGPDRLADLTAIAREAGLPLPTAGVLSYDDLSRLSPEAEAALGPELDRHDFFSEIISERAWEFPASGTYGPRQWRLDQPSSPIGQYRRMVTFEQPLYCDSDQLLLLGTTQPFNSGQPSRYQLWLRPLGQPDALPVAVDLDLSYKFGPAWMTAWDEALLANGDHLYRVDFSDRQVRPVFDFRQALLDWYAAQLNAPSAPRQAPAGEAVG
jgi:hypothetical protein